MKIAMWSGPRNLSTAMMYAFGCRPDFAAWDEPFYAAYLVGSGLDHPMGAEIVAIHETDPHAVAARCAGPVPDGKDHWYMKHMAFHMLPGFPLDWADTCVNVHLVRHPAYVVDSYARKRENPTLDDLGFRQHTALYERFPGPVVDCADIRRDPAGILGKLCDAIGLDFSPAMLTWPEGPKPFDGVWAPHWYGAVHASTGFAGAEPPPPVLQGAAAALVEAAMPYYEALADRRLA